MVYYFAVWEVADDGSHDGYVDHSPVNAPLLSERAVGYRGASSFADAVASVKDHKAIVCDGYCDASAAHNRRMRLGCLATAYNRATAPSVMRTDAEHERCKARARAVLARLRAEFVAGVDYTETEDGVIRTARGDA